MFCIKWWRWYTNPIFPPFNHTKLQWKSLGSLLNYGCLWIRCRHGGCLCSLMCRFRACWKGSVQSMGVTVTTGGFCFTLLAGHYVSYITTRCRIQLWTCPLLIVCFLGSSGTKWGFKEAFKVPKCDLGYSPYGRDYGRKLHSFMA